MFEQRIVLNVSLKTSEQLDYQTEKLVVDLHEITLKRRSPGLNYIKEIGIKIDPRMIKDC